MASPVNAGKRERRGSLLSDERGAEQMEYVLILAGVVLPMAVAARLLWALLLFYFGFESLVVDLPLF